MSNIILQLLPAATAGYNGGMSILTHLQSQNPTLFGIIQKVTRYTNWVGFGLACGQGVAISKILLDKYKLTPTVVEMFKSNHGGPWIIAGVTAFGATVAVCILATRVLQSCYKPKQKILDDLKEQEKIGQGEKDLKISWGNSSYQHTQQLLLVAQWITSAALIVLSSSPIAYTINTLALTYSLHKTSSWKAIKVELKYVLKPADELYKKGMHVVTYAYFLSLFPSSSKNPTPNKGLPETYFCRKHALPVATVLKSVVNSALNALTQQFNYNMEENPHTHSKTIAFTLKNTTLPACETCKVSPKNNAVEIKVEGVTSKGTPFNTMASVHFVDKLPTT